MTENQLVYYQGKMFHCSARAEQEDSLYYQKEYVINVCESGELENEFHFIFSCTLYNNIRATFFQNIGNIIPNIMQLNEVSQIKTFMSKNFVCLFAKLICDMFQKRHDSLFI